MWTRITPNADTFHAVTVQNRNKNTVLQNQEEFDINAIDHS